MKEQLNYEIFLKVANAISHSKEPEDVALMTPFEGVPVSFSPEESKLQYETS